jgi:hypothetical protein
MNILLLTLCLIDCLTSLTKQDEEDEIIFRLSKYPYTQNITIHSINPWTDEVVGTNLKIPNQIS